MTANLAKNQRLASPNRLPGFDTLRAVAIAVGSEKLWFAFCRAIERPDLEARPQFATNAERIRNRTTLEPLLEEVFRARPVAHWIARLHGAGIPASPVC